MKLTGVKISEHLARMGMTNSAVEMLLNGAYVRDVDRVVLLVKDMKVSIGMTSIELSYENDQFFCGDFTLERVEDGVLRWVNDRGEIIRWVRVDEEQVRAITEYIDNITHRVKVSTHMKEEGDGVEPKTDTQQAPPTNSPPTHVTPTAVNEMIVPVLHEPDLLSLHLEQITALATALNIIEKTPRGSRIHDLVKVPFAMKLIESLKEVRDIENTVRQNLIGTGYDFFKLKEILVRNYCTPTKLRRTIKARLATLKFISHSRVEAFISHASLIVALVRQLGEKDWTSDYVVVVETILSKLPQPLKQKIHARMSDAGDESSRWELGLPFDECCKLSKGFIGDHTVVDILRVLCERHLQLEELGPNTNPTRTTEDRVNRVYEKSAEEFSKSFASTYVVFPKRGAFIRDCESKLKEAGMEPRRAMSAKGSTYFIVGSPLSGEETEKFLREMNETFGTFRPFVVKSQVQKNSH